MIGYLVGLAFILTCYRQAIPNSGWFIAGNGAAIVTIVASARISRGLGRFIHEWYQLLFLGGYYYEISLLVASLRADAAMDAKLAQMDVTLLSVTATALLDRFSNPFLTEFLQIIYVLYIPALVSVLVLLRLRGRRADFHYGVFLLSLGLVASYIGYLLVPALGPRSLFDEATAPRLTGVWTFDFMRKLVERLEAPYDCFPSGHALMVLLAWWCSRRVSPAFFAGIGIYTGCLVFSTVYLDYHYVVDVLAAAVLAAGLVATAPWLFLKLAAQHELQSGHAVRPNERRAFTV